MKIHLSMPFKPAIGHTLRLGLILLAITMWSCNEDEAINPAAPQACITVPEGDMYADATLTFNGSCSKNASTYAWEFSDGRKYTSVEVRRSFADAGDFMVTLTITDSLGRSTSSNKNFSILPSPYVIHEGYISTDEVWEEGLHLVKNDVFIEGGSVQIMPGATIYVNKKVSIFIGDTFSSSGDEGLLTAIGTAQKPITFLPASGVEAPGEWGHIYFTSNTTVGSALKHCIIKYGGKGGNYHFTENDYLLHGVVDLAGCTVAIDNTTITGGANYGINVIGMEGQFSSFTNNTITANTANPVRIQVNAVHTIGENNTFEGDGILLKDRTFLTTEAIWRKQNVPYVIDGYFEIGSNTASGTYHLTLEPGVQIDFTKGSIMSVPTTGTLTAAGTSALPILFTSHEAVKAKGDWQHISVSGNAVFNYCQFEYGGNDDLNYMPYMVALSGSSTVNNSTFIHSATDGLRATGSGLAGSSANTFRDCDRYGLTVEATLAHKVDLSHTFDCVRNIHIQSSPNDLNETVTWPKRAFPYYFSGELDIRDNAVGPGGLIIAAGTEIRFLPQAQIVVDGTFIADGTTEPIIFTIDEASTAVTTNYWSGIFFTSGTSADSKLAGCKVSYGGNNPGYPSRGTITCNSVGTPLITNNEITNSASHGISIGVSASPVMSGNTFANNTGSDVYQQ